MAFVLDASMTASWCFDDERTPYSQSVLAVLLGSYAVVPALWPFEVANVLAINERKGRITESGSNNFLKIIAGLNIRIESPEPVLAGKLMTLTRDFGLTAYDASYLELSLRRRLPIATLDRALRKAASLAGITLVEQSKLYPS